MESKSDTKINGVDSCVLLRYILWDVPEQGEKARLLFVDGHDFYVDDVAIMEVVHVLTKHHKSRRVIADDILDLLRNQMFVWDRDFFEPVFKEYLEHPSLSFDDIVLAKRVTDKKYTCLWTFDRKFANQAKVARLLG